MAGPNTPSPIAGRPDPPDPAAILERCRALGFAAAGIASAEPSTQSGPYRAWIAAGKHGSMGYLAQNADIRGDVGRLLPGAHAVIMVLDLYESRPTESGRAAPARTDVPDRPDGSEARPLPGPLPGVIARYSRGRDYHAVIKRRLHALADELRADHPGHQFRSFTDTAPVLERELAARAGLGWQAKHTLLIHPRLGSWTLLGGIATTLPLAPPPAQRDATDHCGSCTRCIDACPTDAISPYSVDARRCISYLTIERRPPIDPGFHAAIGGWLFGCDICQEVCPHNGPANPAWQAADPTVLSQIPNPAYTPVRTGFDPLEVLGWTEADRREAFRGSSLKRATLETIRRNALIVLTNHLMSRGNAPDAGPDAAVRARIAAISVDGQEPALLRETARVCLQRLNPPSRGAAGSDTPPRPPPS